MKYSGGIGGISEKLKKNAGPILYVVVSLLAIWFFYWFAAVVH